VAEAPVLDRSMYYAMVAIDGTGNRGHVSNVYRAYVPSPASLERMTSADASASGLDAFDPQSNPRKDHVAYGGGRNRVLLYIVMGIVIFVAAVIIVIFCIVLGYRKKKGLDTSSSSSNEGSLDSGKLDRAAGGDAEKPSFDSTMRSMGVSAHMNGVQSPGFSVCDDPDLGRENGHFLHGQQQVSFLRDGAADGGSSSNGSHVYASAAAYGWTELNNPYVVSPGGTTYNQPQQSQQTVLPTYRDFQSQMLSSCSDGSGGSGYVPNPSANPTYARPLPRSQRPGVAYSATSTLQHSTPQSKNGSSSNTLQGMSSLFRSQNNAASSLAATIAAANGGGSLSSGDERVPSVSPPAESGHLGTGEQVRLIPPSLSNTPTKSILKKPKSSHHSSAVNESLLASRVDDQGSQSSNASNKAVAATSNRFSSSGSSNVSSNLSDRDTPTEAPAAAASIVRLTKEDSTAPDFSPSNTYLETSFEGGEESGGVKVPPPTLPKPNMANSSQTEDNVGFSTLDRKIRNITQV